MHTQHAYTEFSISQDHAKHKLIDQYMILKSLLMCVKQRYGIGLKDLRNILTINKMDSTLFNNGISFGTLDLVIVLVIHSKFPYREKLDIIK